MTANGVLQLVLYLVVLLALAKPLGWFMARVYEGKPCGLDRVLGPVERLHLPARRRQAPTQEMGWKTYAARRCCSSTRVGLRRRLRAAAAAGVAAAESRRARRGLARLVVQHGRLFRHQHQLAGLRRRDDDVVPHADARAGRAELPLGRDGHGGAGRPHPRPRAPILRHDRQLLGRSDAEHAVHPAAAVDRARGRARVAGRGADVQAVPDGRRCTQPLELRRSGQERRGGQRAGATEPDGRRQAADQARRRSRSRPSRSGPRPRRSPSSNWAPTAAGSSTSTPPTRLENPTPLSNFLEVLAILLIAGALCWTFGEMVGDRRQGWAVLAAMTSSSSCCWRVCVWAEQSGNPQLDRARRRSDRIGAPARRQHGGQGGPLRHRQLRALGDGDDGRLQRLGQLHARLVHAAGRAGADVADPARRGRLRRRGLRPLRHARCSSSSPSSSPA